MAAITRRLRCEILQQRSMMAADVTESMDLTVQSNNTEGLRAAEVEIHFDARALDLDAANIRPGKAWQGNASVISKVDRAKGVASIYLFSVEPVSGTHGGLVDLQFAVRDQILADESSAGLGELRLNEGAIETQATMQPIEGSQANLRDTAKLETVEAVSAEIIRDTTEHQTIDDRTLDDHTVASEPERMRSLTASVETFTEPGELASLSDKACPSWNTYSEQITIPLITPIETTSPAMLDRSAPQVVVKNWKLFENA